MLPALANSIHFDQRLGDPSELDGAASGPFDDPVVPGDDDDASGDDDDTAADDDDDTSADVAFTLVIQNDWGAGYCADVTVENLSSGDLTWQIEAEIEGTMSSLWNAIETPTTDNWVQFVGVSWNATIPAGQTTSFGFCAER
jgi:cellulase/cellobiase CelA1